MTAAEERREHARDAFVHELADALVAAGTQRMAARVFAAVLASDEGELTAAEIAERLGASAASVSGAVRYLEQVGLIRRTRRPGSRRDVFLLGDDAWHEAMVDSTPLLLAWADLMGRGATSLGEDTPAGHRLATSRDFFAFLGARLPGLYAEWRATRHTV